MSECNIIILLFISDDAIKILPIKKGIIGKVRIINIKIGLKVIFSYTRFNLRFLIFCRKGRFFENIKFVFLSKRIWTTPRVVTIGAKKMIYFNPKNFIKIRSNKIHKGRPKNIEKTFISAKYLYSIWTNKFSKPLLYLRKRAKK